MEHQLVMLSRQTIWPSCGSLQYAGTVIYQLAMVHGRPPSL